MEEGWERKDRKGEWNRRMGRGDGREDRDGEWNRGKRKGGEGRRTEKEKGIE